ncbi:MAG: PhnD/SsuA/transferrin family substrate-binding protein [Bacteroidales bacterium]
MFPNKPHYFSLVIVFFLVICSCTMREENIALIDFSDQTAEQTISSGIDTIPVLRVAIAAVISPKESFVYYRELFDFMSDRLNMKIEFKQRMSYEEVNNLLDRNLVDIAFICTGAYIDGSDGFDLLVTPVTKDKPYFHAYVIANENSGIETFQDIRDHSFAYTDPLSFTGRTYPLKRVLDQGSEPDSFFSSLIYTMSHDVSIQMVSRNLVDAASVSGLIFDYLSVNQPEMVMNINIIEKSEDFGMPPVVSSLLLPVETRDRLRELFTQMHEDARGMEILGKLKIEHFVIADDTLYSSARKMRNEAWQ